MTSPSRPTPGALESLKTSPNFGLDQRRVPGSLSSSIGFPRRGKLSPQMLVDTHSPVPRPGSSVCEGRSET